MGNIELNSSSATQAKQFPFFIESIFYGRDRQPFACRGPKTNFITLWRAALFPVTFSVLVIPTEVDIKQQKGL